MSDVLARFQAKIGAAPDGQFGPATLRAARDYFRLTSYQAAHFFAQCYHETGGFTRFEENLNYTSAERIAAVWPSRFPTPASAEPYVRQPEKLANAVYANRMGNGDAASGDGWRYRGRGALHLTGRDNYRRFAGSASAYARALDIPELVASEFAFESAAHFFDTNRVWKIAADGVRDEVIQAVTSKVNGGAIGLAERAQLTKRFFSWMR